MPGCKCRLRTSGPHNNSETEPGGLGSLHTWRIASLCISPVQAGIISFRTANSSFIFDLRRLSIKLWAVFLAIFRPAALVAEGCFFLDNEAWLADTKGVVVVVFAAAAAAAIAATAPLIEVGGIFAAADGLDDVSSVRGFIWMILRDLVGGGGKAKVSFWAADERLRDLTTSLAWTGYGILAGVL